MQHKLLNSCPALTTRLETVLEETTKHKEVVANQPPTGTASASKRVPKVKDWTSYTK